MNLISDTPRLPNKITTGRERDTLTVISNNCYNPLLESMFTTLLHITGARMRRNAAFGQGLSSSPVLLNDVRCTGLEATLFDCPHRGFNRTHSCGHQLDAGVVCNPGTYIHTYMCSVPQEVQCPNSKVSEILSLGEMSSGLNYYTSFS